MINQQLTDYIQAARAAGQTDEQIAQTLAQQGWQQADIQAALVNDNPPQASSQSLSQPIPTQTGQTKKQNFFSKLLFWKLDESELEIQINQYDTLKGIKSWRKFASILTIAVIILTIAGSLVGLVSGTGAVIAGIIYTPFAYLIWKGKKWALIVMMILWTLEKAGSVIDRPASVVIVLIWWDYFMRYYWGAYQVEKRRL